MFWAKIYLFVMVLMSLGGFFLDSKNQRTTSEFALNIISVAAPAILVLAYIKPDLLVYRHSLISLMGITVASNWITGRMYLAEMNEEAPHEEAANFWSMILGVFVLLAPAMWFGALAYARG